MWRKCFYKLILWYILLRYCLEHGTTSNNIDAYFFMILSLKTNVVLKPKQNPNISLIRMIVSMDKMLAQLLTCGILLYIYVIYICIANSYSLLFHWAWSLSRQNCAVLVIRLEGEKWKRTVEQWKERKWFLSAAPNVCCYATISSTCYTHKTFLSLSFFL